MRSRSTLLFFSVCAVADFILGYIKGHSIGAGVAWTIFGLPFTVVLYSLVIVLWKGKHESVAGAPLDGNGGMKREEVESILRANVGNRVRVTFTDGESLYVNITKVDFDGFIHSGADGTEPAHYWTRYEFVKLVEPSK